jgi:hypothetical protein
MAMPFQVENCVGRPSNLDTTDTESGPISLRFLPLSLALALLILTAQVIAYIVSHSSGLGPSFPAKHWGGYSKYDLWSFMRNAI